MRFLLAAVVGAIAAKCAAASTGISQYQKGFVMTDFPFSSNLIRYTVCLSSSSVTYSLETSTFGGTRSSTFNSDISSSSCSGNLCAVSVSCESFFDDDDDFSGGCSGGNGCIVFNKLNGSSTVYGSIGPYSTGDCDPVTNPSITDGMRPMAPSSAACDVGNTPVLVIIAASAGALFVVCIIACVSFSWVRRRTRSMHALSSTLAASAAPPGMTRGRLVGGQVVSVTSPVAASSGIAVAHVIRPPVSSPGHTHTPSASAAPAPVPPPPAGTMAGYSPYGYGSTIVAPPPAPAGTMAGYSPYGHTTAPAPAPQTTTPGAYPGATTTPGAYPGATTTPGAYPGATTTPGAYPGATAPSAPAPGTTSGHQGGSSNTEYSSSGFGL